MGKKLRQNWSGEETKMLKARSCSEKILDKLKYLSDSYLDLNIVTVSLTQFLHEDVGRVLKPIPPKKGSIR